MKSFVEAKADAIYSAAAGANLAEGCCRYLANSPLVCAAASRVFVLKDALFVRIYRALCVRARARFHSYVALCVALNSTIQCCAMSELSIVAVAVNPSVKGSGPLQRCEQRTGKARTSRK